MKKATVFLSLVSAILISCGPTSEAPEANSTTSKDAVIENIMSRRSIRKYKNEAIDSTSMREILTCGIQAPNGQGRESWEIRVVDDKELIDRIDSAYSDYAENTIKTGKPTRKASYGAPALVFIAYDTTYDLSQVDCGLLGENMILAANSMGIGSCCLGGLCRFINSEEGAEILQKLKLPSTHKLLYAIAFGYPDEKPAQKTRNWDRIQFIENN